MFIPNTPTFAFHKGAMRACFVLHSQSSFPRFCVQDHCISMDMHPAKFPSDAAYGGRTLWEGIEGYAIMYKEWAKLLAKLVMSWFPRILYTHHRTWADPAFAEYINTESVVVEEDILLVNEKRTLLIRQPHKDYILKSKGRISVLVGLRVDYHDLFVLRLITDNPCAVFDDNDSQHQGFRFGRATMGGHGVDLQNARLIVDKQRAGIAHHLTAQVCAFTRVKGKIM
jgi:hypothetical protein